MADREAHEEIFSDLRANLAAYLRADTMPPRGPVRTARAPAPFLHPDAAPPADGDPACVVGIIDDAIPPAHPRLTARAPGATRARSRIASLWIMGGEAAPDGEVPFGREWRGAEIDALTAGRAVPGAGLDEEALYRGAGIWRAARGPMHGGGRRAAHGAAVADLAAGMDPRDPAARLRPVIGACLPPEVTRDTSGTFAPWFVLLGTLHILDRARRLAAALGRPPLPVVINLSYGVTAGVKDGTGLVEGFQRTVAEQGVEGVGPVRFVLPMGNHRQGRLRARVATGGALRWLVPPDDATPSFLSLHGPPRDGTPEPMTIFLAPPGEEERRLRLPHGTASELTIRGRHVARAYAGLTRAPCGGLREMLTVALPATDEDAAPRGAAGLWSLRVEGDGPFDAHVQRDDAIPGFGGGARQMRIVDAVWQAREESGRMVDFDDADAGPILREGTVNAWANAGTPWQLAASGTFPARPAGPPWRAGAAYAGGAEPGKLAPYSALPDDVRAADHPAMAGGAGAVTDLSPGARGVPAAGAFAGARVRVTGTSVAAPQVARALAAALAAGGDPEGPLRPPAPPERRGY